ncbi:unnamed protein product [Amoebophrya sp. A25]|nr:unnamed protein product [Amoebophrya sp. A25]|eukprot:GSA25T00018485001.1
MISSESFSTDVAAGEKRAGSPFEATASGSGLEWHDFRFLLDFADDFDLRYAEGSCKTLCVRTAFTRCVLEPRRALFLAPSPVCHFPSTTYSSSSSTPTSSSSTTKLTVQHGGNESCLGLFLCELEQIFKRGHQRQRRSETDLHRGTCENIACATGSPLDYTDSSSPELLCSATSPCAAEQGRRDKEEDPASHLQNNSSFHFASFILEALVCASTQLLQTQFSALATHIESSLADIVASADEESILRLFPLRSALREIQDQVSKLRNGLSGYHEREDEEQQLGSFAGTEDVCRYWFLESRELSSEIGELLKTIDETSKFLEASMDARRNQLLRMEVTLDVVAVVFSFGALVSGIFGMNLKSGMEETPGMFPAVIAMICLVGCLMALGCAAYYVRNKRHRVYHRIYKRCSLYYSKKLY